jgi:hypothetical protein
VQTAVDSGYVYTFTEMPKVKVWQRPDGSRPFVGDYTVFNRFVRETDGVKLCSSSGCEDGFKKDLASLRLFTNKAGQEGVEFHNDAGPELSRYSLIIENESDYPGLMVETLLNDKNDLTKRADERIRIAEEIDYNFTQELLEFVDHL